MAALLLAATMVAPPTPSPVAAIGGCAANTSSTALNSLFQSGAAGFVGGDYLRAYPLPDGRTLWTMQDTYLGAVGTPTLNAGRFVHNAAMIQTGSCFETMHGGTPAAPTSFGGGWAEDPLHHWWWALDGGMGVDGMLHIFYAEMVNANGTGAAPGATPVAVWRAVIRLTDLAVVAFVPAADSGSQPLYGFSVANDARWTYLYGNCYRQFTNPTAFGSFDLDCNNDVYVARIPKGQFDAAPAYWTGSGWSAQRNAAATVLTAGTYANPLQVRRLADGRYLAASHLDDWFGNAVTMYVAVSATGPFVPYTSRVIPSFCGFECTTYFAGLTPFVDPNGDVAVTVSRFTYQFPLANANPWMYRPTVHPMPPPAPRVGGLTVLADDTVVVDVGQRFGMPSSPGAVVLTVSATAAFDPGYVVAWSCAGPRPSAATLTLVPGATVTSTTIVGTSTGDVCVWSSATTHIVVDAAGWQSATDPFAPIVPARLADSRSAGQTVDGQFRAFGRLDPGVVESLHIAGRGGLGLDPGMVALNVTAVAPTANGVVKVWDCGPQPATASVNVSAGQTASNLVITALSEAGDVCVSSTTATDVVVDAQAATTSSNVVAVDPARLFDSRPGAATVDGDGRPGVVVANGSVVAVRVAGRAQIDNPEAVILNVAAVAATGAGFVRAWTCSSPQPTVATLTMPATTARSVLAVVAVGSSETVCLTVGGAASAHLIVDVVGYVTASPCCYQPLVGVRLADTRR